MLKKNDQIKIMHICLNMMEFCNESSKIMTPNQMHTETMQKTCEGLSKIFSLLEKDFDNIAKLVMKGFSKKEIKMMLKKRQLK